MTRILFVLTILCSPVFSQISNSDITAFWEMNITQLDRIMWDSKGLAHGMYWGKGLTTPGTVFSGGVNTILSASEQGGIAVPGGLVPQTGSFTWGIWCRHKDSDIILKRSNGVSGGDYGLFFNSGTDGFPQVAIKLEDGSTTTHPAFTYPQRANNGDLSLVWFAYDNADGSIKIALNDGAWSSTVPASPVIYAMTQDVFFGNTRLQFDSETVVGRSLYMNGHIASDSERSWFYNSGAGRTYTDINPTGFNSPTRPFTASLVDSNFASDAALPGEEGLYWLRPYPVKNWGASVRAAFGYDYAWVRSPDHQTCSGTPPDAVYLGGSNSPTVLPSSWTAIATAASLSAADPSKDWCQMHPPYLVWNPDTNLVHLYHTAEIYPVADYWSVHLWTSPDLSTWTWVKETLPYGTAIPGGTADHPGYMAVVRRGTGDWVAQSIVNSEHAPYAPALWTSADGVDWTFSAYTDNMQSVTLTGGEMGRWDNIDNAAACGALRGGQDNAAYMGYHGTSIFEATNPAWLAFTHNGTGSGGDWLQDVRCYQEAGTVYMYAKWAYEQPATVRLYSGNLSGSPRRAGAFGAIRLGGGAKVQ